MPSRKLIIMSPNTYAEYRLKTAIEKAQADYTKLNTELYFAKNRKHAVVTGRSAHVRTLGLQAANMNRKIENLKSVYQQIMGEPYA